MLARLGETVMTWIIRLVILCALIAAGMFVAKQPGTAASIVLAIARFVIGFFAGLFQIIAKVAEGLGKPA